MKKKSPHVDSLGNKATEITLYNILVSNLNAQSLYPCPVETAVPVQV